MSYLKLNKNKDGFMLHLTMAPEDGDGIASVVRFISEQDVIDNPKAWGDLATWIEFTLQGNEVDEIVCACGWIGKPKNRWGKYWNEGDDSAKHCGGCGNKLEVEE